MQWFEYNDGLKFLGMEQSGMILNNIDIFVVFQPCRDEMKSATVLYCTATVHRKLPDERVSDFPR